MSEKADKKERVTALPLQRGGKTVIFIKDVTGCINRLSERDVSSRQPTTDLPGTLARP
jgi:hypothetical protein